MNGEGLQQELTQRGIAVRVETWERLAVLVPEAGAPPLAADDIRGEIQSLATRHGFTHVAIELTEDWCSGASLPRRQPD